jgi:FkbM family methyltransferase
MQFIKDKLVRLGPDHVLVQAALRYHARRQGYKLEFDQARIQISKQKQIMFLPKSQYVQVPFMIKHFDFYFNTTESQTDSGCCFLDFSKPNLHRYTKSGVGFYFPSVPEDDVMEAYIHWHRPSVGEVVWDVGAHAGASAYFFSQMVGHSGRVYAFEPDEGNYEYLVRNIDLHGLQNVVPVKMALARQTGKAKFNMDGTMSAGLTDYLVYADNERLREVHTISFADACERLGSIPNFVKMDIEGAEVSVVESCRQFLERHGIHFAIESNHTLNGEPTSRPLERIFLELGYNVLSSEDFGQLFTWAAPR